MVPKTGFSQRTRRQWAGWMCKEKNPDCLPEWISEKEIYDFWYQSVKTNGTAAAIDTRDDGPPF